MKIVLKCSECRSTKFTVSVETIRRILIDETMDYIEDIDETSVEPQQRLEDYICNECGCKATLDLK